MQSKRSQTYNNEACCGRENMADTLSVIYDKHDIKVLKLMKEFKKKAGSFDADKQELDRQ